MSNQKKQSGEAAVREIRCRTRRKFSPEEKIRIVLEGFRGEESIADLCRLEGIASNLSYPLEQGFSRGGEEGRWCTNHNSTATMISGSREVGGEWATISV